MKRNTKITILGAGKFGTALHTVLAKGGVNVCAWDICDGPNVERDLKKALSFSTNVIIAVATQHVRNVCQAIQNKEHTLSTCWIASKGFEKETGWLMSDVINHFFPSCTIGILSGPNIAKDMEQGWPCGLTLASLSPDLLCDCRTWWTHTPIILDETDDIWGVQAMGGLKNIIAIGYGLLEQHCPSANMHATYLSLAMQETAKIIRDLGGKTEILSCFAGWADVMVSCAKGRNRQFGLNFPQPYSERAEGVDTLFALSKKIGHQWHQYPLFQCIFNVISGHQSAEAVYQYFLKQPIS